MSPDSKKPILFEVFTEMSTDAKVLHDYYESNMSDTDKLVKNAKQAIKKIIGEEVAKNIKNRLRK